MAELEFNEARHEYRLDGRSLPSVTKVLGILQDFGGVPAEVLARAAEFGRHVHQAVDLYNKRTLDEGSLDPALVPYLDAWRTFLADTGAVVVESEKRVWHRTLHYAGTLDVLADWRGRRCLIDIKTGALPRTVGAQTAAYWAALDSIGGRAASNRPRYCVQLSPNRYQIHHLKDPSDWSLFQSALNCWRFINAG